LVCCLWGAGKRGMNEQRTVLYDHVAHDEEKKPFAYLLFDLSFPISLMTARVCAVQRACMDSPETARAAVVLV
jgi:hypothetical protein